MGKILARQALWSNLGSCNPRKRWMQCRAAVLPTRLSQDGRIHPYPHPSIPTIPSTYLDPHRPTVHTHTAQWQTLRQTRPQAKRASENQCYGDLLPPCQAPRHTPGKLALLRGRQEDQNFKVSGSYLSSQWIWSQPELSEILLQKPKTTTNKVDSIERTWEPQHNCKSGSLSRTPPC